MPLRVKLTLEYDGTDFAGWQVQGGGAPGEVLEGGARTVQGELERALREILGRPIRVTGAGRTDAGVHAVGQVASFEWPEEARIEIPALAAALNAHLPADVSIRESIQTSPEFHARASARAKRYDYRIWNAAHRSPLRSRSSWQIRYPLDLEAMRAAAGALVGTHDFAAFSVELAEARAERAREGKGEFSSVREIYSTRWVALAPVVDPHPQTGERRELVFSIEGSGFLYKMVRSLVGSLVEVGRGKRPPEWMAQVLASRDRRQAGPTAPPQGLSLMWVAY